MIGKNFVSRFAIAPPRRGLATAVVYGLSLAVRFTSAAGEEVEIPPQSVQRAHPLISIMTRDGFPLPNEDWGPQVRAANRLSPRMAFEFVVARLHRTLGTRFRLAATR
jgi:hypothetical protein